MAPYSEVQGAIMIRVKVTSVTKTVVNSSVKLQV